MPLERPLIFADDPEDDQHVWKRRLQPYLVSWVSLPPTARTRTCGGAWTGIRVPLVVGIVASFEYEIDFDSAPAVEAETTDHTIRLELGYKW